MPSQQSIYREYHWQRDLWDYLTLSLEILADPTPEWLPLAASAYCLRQPIVKPSGDSITPPADRFVAQGLWFLPPGLTPRLPAFEIDSFSKFADFLSASTLPLHEPTLPLRVRNSTSALLARRCHCQISLCFLCWVFSDPERFPFRYYPCPSLQKLTSNFSPAVALLQKFDLLNSLCVSSKWPSILLK